MAVLILVTAAVILAPVLRRDEGGPESGQAPPPGDREKEMALGVGAAGALDLDARIEAEIAAARGGARCPSCGATLPRQASFCPACGAPAGPGVKP